MIETEKKGAFYIFMIMCLTNYKTMFFLSSRRNSCFSNKNNISSQLMMITISFQPEIDGQRQQTIFASLIWWRQLFQRPKPSFYLNRLVTLVVKGKKERIDLQLSLKSPLVLSVVSLDKISLFSEMWPKKYLAKLPS